MNNKEDNVGLRGFFVSVQDNIRIFELWADFIADFREAFLTGDASKLVKKWSQHEFMY